MFIKPTYAEWCANTQFWNASGISIDANLSGVEVGSESLASIVAGGIAFATPENRKDSPPTDPSLPFRLYEDFDAAAAGIRVKVKLSDFEGLQAGRTPVMYKGIQVGNMKALKIDPDLNSATAELTLDPLAEDYLVEGTQFSVTNRRFPWPVSPGSKRWSKVTTSPCVRATKVPRRNANSRRGQKPRRWICVRRDLHLVLFTDVLGSIEVGSPILYKQVKVGSVQSYQFSKTKKANRHRRAYREGVRKLRQRVDTLLECQQGHHPHRWSDRWYSSEERVFADIDGRRYRFRNAASQGATAEAYSALPSVRQS